MQISFSSIRQLTTSQQKTVQTVQASPQKVPEKQYKPPALGVNPAYDEALKYIYLDKAKKYEKIKMIERRMTKG